MNCHIVWHTSEGFALQLIERHDEIKDLIDYRTLDENCAAWTAYDSTYGIEQEDWVFDPYKDRGCYFTFVELHDCNISSIILFFYKLLPI